MYTTRNTEHLARHKAKKKVLKEEKIYVNCVAPHLYFFKLIIAEFFL